MKAPRYVSGQEPKLPRLRRIICAAALLAALVACASPADAPAQGLVRDGEGEPGGEGEAFSEGEGEGEGGSDGEGEAIAEGEGEGKDDNPTTPSIPYVFVIAMENKAEAGIYGNALAPYINDVLVAEYGSASAYTDCLPDRVSEPHYVWLEAGTNAFSDHTFLYDSNPSPSNSTADTRHIATQLEAQGHGRTWRSYQEGLDANTGACPIHSSGFYAPKHDPFVFFQDVAGNPPDDANAYCAAHHRAYDRQSFQEELAAGDVDVYTFITPDLCNDMHGKSSCTNGCTSSSATACISAGDSWLADNVPPIIQFINEHGGVLFIVWDETEGENAQPFLVVGPGVKPGHQSDVAYDHSSYVKSVQAILGIDIDARVAAANDFGDFFDFGAFP